MKNALKKLLLFLLISVAITPSGSQADKAYPINISQLASAYVVITAGYLFYNADKKIRSNLAKYTAIASITAIGCYYLGHLKISFD